MADAKPSVYVETSIIGYAASRLSRDMIVAANQQLTQTWWLDHRENYELFISQFVIDECSAGDPNAAQERLTFLAGIAELDAIDEVHQLGDELMKCVPLPERAQVDALHIAVAAYYGIEYLLTWNCTHIANATLLRRIGEVCRANGCVTPVICTPPELMGLDAEEI